MKYKNYLLNILAILLIASNYACSEKKDADLNKTNNTIVSEPSKQPQKVEEKKETPASNNPAEKKVEEEKKEIPFVFDKNKEYKVQIETTMGNIKIKMFNKESPKSVENFVTLISKKYYDGIIFHRVIKGFMIQTGDPTGTGTGGMSAFGKDFENEDSPNLSYNKAGIVGMANRGKDTNSSQFFITTQARQSLDHNYTIFGEVIEGLDVVMSIEKVKTNEKDKPLSDVKMTKVTLVD
ncbi:MAG: peptidylprolyl isomerase [Candidatus Sericytochromatia bacterium]